MILKQQIKWVLFPGINLHTRERYSVLPDHFPEKNSEGDGPPLVLDAGCGNGMLSWKAYRKGARVVGITLKKNEESGCRTLFNEKLGVSDDRLTFRIHNLYDVDALLSEFGQFDQIICTEVLEHIRDDAKVCEAFWRLLKPGGHVHLTAPNAEHPYNASFPLDLEETGGHVRAGYTTETFRNLLEPLGFRIDATRGLGGPVRQAFSSRIKALQERLGPAAGFPLFLVSLPFLVLDRGNPRVPFSVYVRACKPQS